MASPTQDWFAANAPQPAAQPDWFAANAPQPQFAPPPGTPTVPKPQVNMQPESVQEALGGNDLEGMAGAAQQYGSQFINRVHDNLQGAADQVDQVVQHPEEIGKALSVKTPHSLAALEKNAASAVPDYGLNRKTLVNLPADVATGALLDAEGKVPEAGKEVVSDIQQGAQNMASRRMVQSVRAAMPAETSALPNGAIQGAEDVIRAAAPVGTNTRFRANVYAAAGDLAEIGRDVQARLSQAKGGIIQPDMRARVVVDAINDHLADMYQNERAAQINRNPQAPVKLEMSGDLQSGLITMARSGEAATRAVARKALGGQITLEEADTLARGVNAELQKFEAMTPEQQAAARVNQRAVTGLKTADRTLAHAIDDELLAQGQPGVASYERRYAGLSAIRSQLERRVNMAELQHPGPIRAAGRAARAVFSGNSGLAGASQAAVADVSTGRALERGLGRLADSGIQANRALPRNFGLPEQQFQLTLPSGQMEPAAQRPLPFHENPEAVYPSTKPGGETKSLFEESGPSAPERRGGGDKGGPRASVLSEAEREQIRAKLREVEQGLHPNPHVQENPFDRHPSHNETIKSPHAEAALRGALDALSGR